MNSYGEFDFRVAETRLNGSGRWLYAAMSGGLDRVGYAYDELRDGRERLFGFRKLADYAIRFTETLSYQALPGWDTARRLGVILTRADFDVATDDNRTGTINSELTYRIRTAGTRALRLGLFNNRDPDTASWSSSHQKLVVKRVVGPGGKELTFAHKYDEILVEIPPTASPNANVTLRFETAGDVFVDMAWRHTDNYFTLGYGLVFFARLGRRAVHVPHEGSLQEAVAPGHLRPRTRSRTTVPSSPPSRIDRPILAGDGVRRQIRHAPRDDRRVDGASTPTRWRGRTCSTTCRSWLRPW
jgi:hypothetical protein